jgi:UDP-2,3-diacylglucosamine pyrophosphatase LpxH
MTNHDLIFEKEDGVIAILSDFHIGEGFLPEKRVFARTENFFQDKAFSSFLQHLDYDYAGSGKRITLVLNGDFLDFLRVRSLPAEDEHRLFQRYMKWLSRHAIDQNFTIDEHEMHYGLSTHELKSVWKLRRICKGHPLVFKALAEFVVQGHRLILVKGNHDLEFYWPKVQAEFRKLLASKLLAVNGVLKTARERIQFIRENVIFCQRAIKIENTMYIEHGHQYEPVTSVYSTPERSGELALPPGSLFNRYLINTIETISPFVANVRPLSEFLKKLSLKQKIQLIRVVFRHFPIAAKMVLRHHSRFGLILLLEALPHLIGFLYALFGIFLPLVWQAYSQFYVALTGEVGAFLVKNWFLNSGLAIAGFFGLRKLVQFAGKNHKFDLKKDIATAKERLGPPPPNTKRRFIVFSHTHRAENCYLGDGWWYINTGTWIPIIDSRELVLHKKLTLSYVLFEKDEKDEWDFRLQQWNDEKEKSEELILLES